MTLRDRIENNPFVWLASASLVAFAAGFGADRTIIEVAQLEVISRVELDRLRAASSAPISVPTAPARSSHDLPPPLALPKLKFSPKQPLIEGFEAAVPGIRLSDAQRFFPGGVTTSATYQVRLESPHFRHLVFGMSSASADPVIDTVVFTINDEQAAKAVLLGATTQFAALAHDSLALGARVIWPDIGGFTLEVDYRGYMIFFPHKPAKPSETK
jgi:hypothetical protein